MDKITTTIQREWLKEIADGTKKVEYRDIKPYWAKRFSAVKVPFLPRLINGMRRTAPEVIVVVKRIRKNSRTRQFELVLGSVVQVKYWSVKHGRPAAT
jgi:hypothetical protein